MQWQELMELNPEVTKLLAKMPPEIASRCLVKKFSPKNIVVKKEEVVEYVYLLLKGEMKVLNEFANGKIYIFSNVLPLNFIGELEVLSEEPVYAVTLEAVNECLTLQIPAEDFTRWLERDPAILMITAKILAKKMYPTSFANGNIFFPGIYKVQAFLVKYYREKATGNEPSLLIEARRQQIADEIGVGVKTVNRSVKKLKEEGLVGIRKGKITVNKDQYLKLLSIVKE